jgi:ribosomal protein L11 methyltransferase
MPTVRLVVSTTQKLLPLVSEVLFEAGAGGLEERPGRGATLVAYGDSRRTLEHIWSKTESVLQSVLPTKQWPKAKLEVDEAETWRTDWTRHLRPVQLTPKLWLAPDGCAPPALRAKQRVISYAPALAFGDGDHPTTRMASRAIASHYEKHPGGALLDIGSGTGVLSFVAVASGAKRALGTDIAEEALRAATINAELNGLAKQTRFVPSGARISGTFDLVVVNIELRPLIEVLGQLPAAARRAPRLLVTGFLASQAAEVSKAVKHAGFAPKSRKKDGDWRLLVAAR